MIIDNKFGKTIGIDLAKVEKMNKDDIKETYNKEKKRFLTEIAKFEQQTGKTYENICRVVKHLENYEYDCRVAIFMLLGVRYSDCSGFWGDKYHWPFTVTKDGKTTTWCNAFQNAIQLYDFQKTLDLKVSKDERLTRFGYQRLQNIEEKLIKKIEIEQKQEDKLAAKIDKKGVNAAKEDIEDYEFLLNATTSRKENWILEDILLGNSLSFTIYHWMNAMSRKAKINFDIYVGLIRVFSSLKCFQLRNIIADGVLRVIFAENDFSEKKY